MHWGSLGWIIYIIELSMIMTCSQFGHHMTIWLFIIYVSIKSTEPNVFISMSNVVWYYVVPGEMKILKSNSWTKLSNDKTQFTPFVHSGL